MKLSHGWLHTCNKLISLSCVISSRTLIQVDARFMAEIVLVKQSMEHLSELTGYTSDGAPDVYIFTFSTLRVRHLLLTEMCVYLYMYMYMYTYMCM